jgi:hypothetical protein
MGLGVVMELELGADGSLHVIGSELETVKPDIDTDCLSRCKWEEKSSSVVMHLVTRR